jgi:hypothetical protein
MVPGQYANTALTGHWTTVPLGRVPPGVTFCDTTADTGPGQLDLRAWGTSDPGAGQFAVKDSWIQCGGASGWTQVAINNQYVAMNAHGPSNVWYPSSTGRVLSLLKPKLSMDLSLLFRDLVIIGHSFCYISLMLCCVLFFVACASNQVLINGQCVKACVSGCNDPSSPFRCIPCASLPYLVDSPIFFHLPSVATTVPFSIGDTSYVPAALDKGVVVYTPSIVDQSYLSFGNSSQFTVCVLITFENKWLM